MNGNSLIEALPVHEPLPSKGERLRRIFERLARQTPATNAQEAHAMVAKAFEDVERDAGVPEADQMEVYPFQQTTSLGAQWQPVFYQIYNRHVMFFGGNGAFDIRLIDRTFPVTDTLLAVHPMFPKERMRAALQKAGADGRMVWS